MTTAANPLQLLNRSLDQWANSNPQYMSEVCSPAAIMFALRDAQHDIAVLAKALEADSLRTARGAIRELERKVFEQEQALAVMRTCLARHQRDEADPPGYLQDAVIRAAGLGAMAEELAAFKRAHATPTQPATGGQR